MTKVFSELEPREADAAIGGLRASLRTDLPAKLRQLPGLVLVSDEGRVQLLADSMKGRDIRVEIGPGKGGFICQMASQHEDVLFVGLEARLSYCVRTLRRARSLGLSNVFVIFGDARLTAPMVFEPQSIAEIYLLFPDPWWKRRHARRRFGPQSIESFGNLLRPKGLFVVKSDVPQYFEWLVRVIEGCGLFLKTTPPEALPPTDRERRLMEDDSKVFVAAFRRL